jgi:DNA-directed RNA polymerase specialized sigma24 family protein
MAEPTEEITKLLRALLMLAIDEREARMETMPGRQKIEVLLDAAGLDSSEIAALTGKQPGSVRMTLSRVRKGTAKKTQESIDG